jgi:glycosyltransferase involved in cell wall biosynthesis
LKNKIIIHLITTIERGGAEKQLLTLVQEQVRAGLCVTVIPLKGRLELRDEFEKAGAVVAINYANKKLLVQMFGLRKFINHLNDKTAVIHAHLPRAEIMAFLTSVDVPYLVSRHNTEAFFPAAPRILSNGLSKLILLKAKACIAISPAVDEFLRKGGELNASTKISIIPYGFSPKKHLDQNKLEGIRKEFNKPDSIIIGTIGRLTKQKDYPTLMKAFYEVVRINPNACLLIIGEGELAGELVQYARELRIDQNIVWIGKTEYVNEYLSVISVFVLSSIYEGFGLVLLEAMQMHVPIVASRNSAIPDVLGAEHPGLVTTGDVQEFAKKILQFSRPEEKTVIKEIQERRLTLFTPDIMSERINDLYEKILFTKFEN